MKGLGFYEAAAQIIPILLLVVAIESGVFRRASTRLERVLALGVLLLVAWGEVTALHVLETEEFGSRERYTVWGAIAVLGGLVAVSPRVWGDRGPPTPLTPPLPSTGGATETSEDTPAS